MKKRIFLVIFGLGLLAGAPACLVVPGKGDITATPEEPLPTETSAPPATGALAIEIRYTDRWVRETFHYQPDAPTIRHLALVMPVESTICLESPGWVFTSLEFAPYPQPMQVRRELVEYIPLLEFIYDAPQGQAVIDLAPGEYNLAVAFIAAALPPPDEDAILYPGVTGGGASTEFQRIFIAAGKTLVVLMEITDEDGWG